MKITNSVQRWIHESRRNGNTSALVRACVAGDGGVIITADKKQEDYIERLAKRIYPGASEHSMVATFPATDEYNDGLKVVWPVFIDNHTVMCMIDEWASAESDYKQKLATLESEALRKKAEYEYRDWMFEDVALELTKKLERFEDKMCYSVRVVDNTDMTVAVLANDEQHAMELARKEWPDAKSIEVIEEFNTVLK